MPPEIFPLRWESTGDQWWFVSPIDLAAANGQYDLVRELLRLDTNLLIKLTSLRRIRRLETVWDDEEQFHDVAVCRGQVARQLLAECETTKGHNTLIRAGYGGWFLYTAASAGDVEFVRSLLQRDPLLVFGEGEYGVVDMFYAAARSKNAEVFRLLVDCSLKGGGKETTFLEFRWEIMNRAVHAAARGGYVEFLRELLVDCSDVLAYRDAQGSTILHTASGKGRLEVITDLLASYDITNSVDNQGNTALHVAAYRGHLSAVEILVSSSPSLALSRNNYGDTFLHMAVAGFGAPGFRRVDLQRKLMKGILSGGVVNLEEIINARNNNGRTALHTAMTESIQTDLVELLMSTPSINLNLKDSNGNTPLDLLKQQRPRTASSAILIRQIVSAGGISNCRDHVARRALVSHLRMQGIGGSPGSSFRIPDAEIYLHAACDDGSSHEITTTTEHSSCSGLLSGSESGDDRKVHSPKKATGGLKMLLQWRGGKGRKAYADDISVEESYDISSKLENNPIPLRKRFSSVSSPLRNNKMLSVEGANLPSPPRKKKLAAGLMQSVIQLMPRRSSFEASSSKPSWSSPMHVNRGKEVRVSG